MKGCVSGASALTMCIGLRRRARPSKASAGTGRDNTRPSAGKAGPRCAASSMRPPGLSRITPCSALSNSRAQPSRILSNTGAVSATERLMTCSTSAVTVWRSSVSRVSLNSRVFSMATTAWSARVPSSATSSSRKGAGGWRTTISVPMPRPSQRSGTKTCEQSPKRIASTIWRSAGGVSSSASTRS